MTVARVRRRTGFTPHQLTRYLTRDDPHCETKAADVSGVYLASPTNAVVFCVDDDRHPSVGSAASRPADVAGRRLYSALNVRTGSVEGMTAARRTSAEGLRLLDRVIATQPARKESHLIADNLSAHTMKAVTSWRTAHPRMTLQFTPTDRSWLNQVEPWFAKIERDVIARGSFASTAELRRKLMHYIRLHNKCSQLCRFGGPTAIPSTAFI